jgi:hypothetical protein
VFLSNGRKGGGGSLGGKVELQNLKLMPKLLCISSSGSSLVQRTVNVLLKKSVSFQITLSTFRHHLKIRC